IILPLQPPLSTLFPYTTLFRSKFASYPPMRRSTRRYQKSWIGPIPAPADFTITWEICRVSNIWSGVSERNGIPNFGIRRWLGTRSEEHTSELQSRFDLVCRLLL